MKLHLLSRSSILDRSLKVSHHKYPNFLRVWHYHPEFELVVIYKSSGMRFVGDSIERFDSGDVVLIGKDVPHMWLNEDSYFEENSTSLAESIAVHFGKGFLGPDFFEIPEMQPLSNLLSRAERGIKFLDVNNSLLKEFKSLVNLDATSQIVKLIDILSQLAKLKDYKLLASSTFVNSFHRTENRRLDKIYEFVFENFNTPISSGDAAEVAGLSKSAFSRYFKKTHRKAFTVYLNEIRIGYACKLLLENKESITSIAYLSGFNNVSNFNRQFKIIKEKTPSLYLKEHKD